jgi:hypothetical protein
MSISARMSIDDEYTRFSHCFSTRAFNCFPILTASQGWVKNNLCVCVCWCCVCICARGVCARTPAHTHRSCWRAVLLPMLCSDTAPCSYSINASIAATMQCATRIFLGEGSLSASPLSLALHSHFTASSRLRHPKYMQTLCEPRHRKRRINTHMHACDQLMYG